LEKYFGAPFAAKIAKEVVIYLRRSEKDPQLSIFLKYRNHINDRVHQIQDILSTRLHEGLTLEDLAEEVNTSARNLTRIFKKVTGLRVGEYQRLLRIERAKQLLQKGHTQEHVAGEVGLKSRSQLLKLLSD
jgi:transcriptional regulator GlxA family with amidase domain